MICETEGKAELTVRLQKRLQFGFLGILETCTFLTFLQLQVTALLIALHQNNWLRKASCLLTLETCICASSGFNCHSVGDVPRAFGRLKVKLFFITWNSSDTFSLHPVELAGRWWAAEELGISHTVTHIASYPFFKLFWLLFFQQHPSCFPGKLDKNRFVWWEQCCCAGCDSQWPAATWSVPVVWLSTVLVQHLLQRSWCCSVAELQLFVRDIFCFPEGSPVLWWWRFSAGGFTSISCCGFWFNPKKRQLSQVNESPFSWLRVAEERSPDSVNQWCNWLLLRFQSWGNELQADTCVTLGLFGAKLVCSLSLFATKFG